MGQVLGEALPNVQELHRKSTAFTRRARLQPRHQEDSRGAGRWGSHEEVQFPAEADIAIEGVLSCGQEGSGQLHEVPGSVAGAGPRLRERFSTGGARECNLPGIHEQCLSLPTGQQGHKSSLPHRRLHSPKNRRKYNDVHLYVRCGCPWLGSSDAEE